MSESRTRLSKRKGMTVLLTVSSKGPRGVMAAPWRITVSPFLFHQDNSLRRELESVVPWPRSCPSQLCSAQPATLSLWARAGEGGMGQVHTSYCVIHLFTETKPFIQMWPNNRKVQDVQRFQVVYFSCNLRRVNFILIGEMPSSFAGTRPLVAASAQRLFHKPL